MLKTVQKNSCFEDSIKGKNIQPTDKLIPIMPKATNRSNASTFSTLNIVINKKSLNSIFNDDSNNFDYNVLLILFCQITLILILFLKN